MGSPNEKLLEGFADELTNFVRLVEEMDLHGPVEEYRRAAGLIRAKTRTDENSRIETLNSGAVKALKVLMRSPDEAVMENAVTAVHNVTLSRGLCVSILDADVLNDIVYVLEQGNTTAKTNAAATVFNVGRDLPLAERMSQTEQLFPPLVELLKSDSLRAQKDSALALYYLTVSEAGRQAASRVGVVPVLITMLDEGAPDGMEDKCMAVIANICKSSIGREALLGKDENSEEHAQGVSVLGEVLDSGSKRAKEDAVSALLLLAEHSPSAFDLIIKEGVMPSLLSLAKSEQTSVRASEKAKILVELFRERFRMQGQNLTDDTFESFRLRSLSMRTESLANSRMGSMSSSFIAR